MKGTLTDEEREALIAKANQEADYNKGHHWWVTLTTPQRKSFLVRSIRNALYS